MIAEKDPVCGMTVDREHASGEMTYGGRTFFFCSTACLKKFEERPAAYARDESAGQQAPFETHEPPHAKMGGIPLPKFGSAGAGGLEREPGPEMHAGEPAKGRKP